MMLTQQNYYLFPAVIAVAGFLLARYIYTKKKKKEKLVCLLDSDCDAVVHSQYSNFLGIPLEIYGMIYFALMSLFFIAVIFLPYLYSSYLQIIIPIIAFLSFLFSIYLVSIQILLIKNWCMWCLISTILTTLLLIAVLITSPLNIGSLSSVILKI